MGQARQNRMTCPVTGQPMAAAECGAGRITKYACPEGCPQNPWSARNYDRQLAIYDRMVVKSMRRLAEEQARTGRYISLPAEEEMPMMVFFLTRFFRERDGAGRTFLQRWRDQGYAGLANDERVMLEAKSSFFPAAIEVRQVIDDRRVLAVDWLGDPEAPLLIVDRRLAARSCRFSTMLGFLYRTPCHHRMQGAVVTLPDISKLDPGEIVRELIRHQGGPADDPARRADWLLANFERVTAAVSAVAVARHEAMLATMDAVMTRRTYELRCPSGEFVQRLGAHPDIEEEEPEAKERGEGYRHGWAWTIDDGHGGVGRTLLCGILLHRDGRQVRVDTTSARLRDQARPLFEALLGDDARFMEEQAEDMAKEGLSAGRRFYDRALVPPGLLRDPGQVETSQTRLPKEYARLSRDEIMRRVNSGFLKAFADRGVPALDGKTPRQAAAIPALRPALIRLMKTHVRRVDEDNLANGTEIDINGLIRELGLAEIDFPAPPRRRPPPAAD